MRRQYRALILAALTVGLFISGCATAQKHDPILLSNNFNEQVQQEVHVIPVIDARSQKDKDLQDIMGYGMLYSSAVISRLERKGYSVSEHNLDIRNCSSLTNIKTLQDLPCLSSIDLSQMKMILLLSVDDYVPPETMSVNGIAYVTGILYDTQSNSVVWKDGIRKQAGDEALLMYGLGGYFGGLLVKALAPNIIYRNAVFVSINAIMETLPEYPARK